MARVAQALLLATALAVAPTAQAADPPAPWDGSNPFACELQQAGFGGTGPHPEADPYCVEFDKRRQNVSQLGLVEFVSREPARVAAASPKCFYFQSDHWRGSLVQDDATTKTYEWDGHYFFDKASGDGGVWVTNFNFAGVTGDPRAIPGFPESYKPYFGPGTGGVRSRNSVPTDPRCAARAARERARIYAGGRSARCVNPGRRVSPTRLGALRIGETESQARRALGPPRRVKRGFLRWCVRGGGRLLAGQGGDRSGELGSGSSVHTLMLVTTVRKFRYRGVGPRVRLRTLRRRLRGERRVLGRGPTDVWLARGGSRVFFGVRSGRVRYLGLRDSRRVKGAGSLRAYLRRAR